MDLAKTRQLLLVALSSTSPGESHNALTAIKTLLAKAKLDIHWLASSLGSTTTSSDPRIGILQERLNQLERHHMATVLEINQLKRENQNLKAQLSFQAPPRGEHSGLSPQRQAEQILLKQPHLTSKERDFLVRVSRWTGTPTDKQLAWLEALWEKYG